MGENTLLIHLNVVVFSVITMSLRPQTQGNIWLFDDTVLITRKTSGMTPFTFLCWCLSSFYISAVLIMKSFSSTLKESLFQTCIICLPSCHCNLTFMFSYWNSCSCSCFCITLAINKMGFIWRKCIKHKNVHFKLLNVCQLWMCISRLHVFCIHACFVFKNEYICYFHAFWKWTFMSHT